MANIQNKVAKLAEFCPQRSLAALNRITGLKFDSYPPSLVAFCRPKRKDTLARECQRG